MNMSTLDLHRTKQGNTTDLSISFPIENEKRAVQVGLKPTAYTLATMQCIMNTTIYVLPMVHGGQWQFLK